MTHRDQLHFVILNDAYMGHAVSLIGPFNSLDEAKDWASSNDWWLKNDQHFTVSKLSSPDLLNRKWEDRKHG